MSITLLSLVILNFSAYNNIFQYFFEEPSLGDYNIPVPQIEPLYSEIEKENLPQILPDIMPTDDRIYIPRIDRNVPLVWPTSEYLEDENWQ
ncbi:MAG: hypothetical protein U9Q15_00340 [Patescibacteria group bacterium]|nr:hypothetical protein [Patescibacteria group bacterium]